MQATKLIHCANFIKLALATWHTISRVCSWAKETENGNKTSAIHSETGRASKQGVYTVGIWSPTVLQKILNTYGFNVKNPNVWLYSGNMKI